MITASRQTAVVSEDGKIELTIPDFAPGARVEVIVLEAPEQEEEDPDVIWERLLNDETKTANFNRWVERTGAGAESEPMDFDRL